MDKKIEVKHDAGFFSCCTIRLKSIIDFYNKNKEYPIVDSSKQWSLYKDKSEDVTNYFFAPNEVDGPMINDYIDFFESNEEQFLEYYKLDYKNIGNFIHKYFSMSLEVEKTMNQLIDKYNLIPQNIIGICYRGNDKCKETNLPNHDEMIEKLCGIKEEFPDYRILIQSDEVDFYQSVLKKFPDAIYFDEILKINSNSNITSPHFVPVGNRLRQAIIFLSISFILSKCSKLVVNSGNVAMWICFFRGNFDGVHQYLNHKDFIYGVKNKNFKILENNWIKK